MSTSTRRRSLVALLGVVFVPCAAHADIVKCIDSAGKVHYVDRAAAGSMKCSPVAERVTVSPSPVSPREAEATTKSAKSAQDRAGQRKALEGELAAEERKLAAAKQALAEQESQRLGGEKNYQRMLDRLQPYQDTVTAQEKRVAELRSQINALK